MVTIDHLGVMILFVNTNMDSNNTKICYVKYVQVNHCVVDSSSRLASIICLQGIKLKIILVKGLTWLQDLANGNSLYCIPDL